MERLRHHGAGIEAGLASIADAGRLAALDRGGHTLRILIEISEQDIGEAHAVASGIAALLGRAGMQRPRLLHGSGATIWDFAALAAGHCWSTRIGLEGGNMLSDGTAVSGNAALVTTAVEMFGQQAALRPTKPHPTLAH